MEQVKKDCIQQTVNIESFECVGPEQKRIPSVFQWLLVLRPRKLCYIEKTVRYFDVKFKRDFYKPCGSKLSTLNSGFRSVKCLGVLATPPWMEC